MSSNCVSNNQYTTHEAMTSLSACATLHQGHCMKQTMLKPWNKLQPVYINLISISFVVVAVDIVMQKRGQLTVTLLDGVFWEVLPSPPDTEHGGVTSCLFLPWINPLCTCVWECVQTRVPVKSLHQRQMRAIKPNYYQLISMEITPVKCTLTGGQLVWCY